MNSISIITCVVGVIGCIIGVATYIGARISKAQQDGAMIAKIDQCVQGINDIKADMKEKNKEVDDTIDQHTKDIVKLQTQMRQVFEHLEIH